MPVPRAPCSAWVQAGTSGLAERTLTGLAHARLRGTRRVPHGRLQPNAWPILARGALAPTSTPAAAFENSLNFNFKCALMLLAARSRPGVDARASWTLDDASWTLQMKAALSLMR